MSAERFEPMSNGRPALAVEDLVKRFKGRRRSPDIVAVDEVSFEIAPGETLGLVGESGSGKSTVARCVLGLLDADSGHVDVLGRTVTRDGKRAGKKELRGWRRDMQIVFQEPLESLNPRIPVGPAVAEPLELHTNMNSEERSTRVRELFELVALDPELVTRYPSQLSGGQQQRVNIARALATEPKVVVLDEPTSSLDVSVRADILKLLVSLQQQLHLTYLLISHDLPTIRNVCDRVAVMYLGRLVEIGPAADVLREPEHPYTEFLLGAELPLKPNESPKAPPMKGEVQPTERPEGCVFMTRCPLKIDRCGEAQPPLAESTPEHEAACIFVGTEHHVADVEDG